MLVKIIYYYERRVIVNASTEHDNCRVVIFRNNLSTTNLTFSETPKKSRIKIFIPSICMCYDAQQQGAFDVDMARGIGVV